MENLEITFNKDHFIETVYDFVKTSVEQDCTDLETIEDLIDLLTELVNRKKEERASSGE